MKKTIVIALLGTAIIATPAFAADFYSPVANDQFFSGSSAFTWTGIYVGANVGYGFGTYETNLPGNPQNDLRGWAGGAQVGANFDLGGVIVGAETDIQLANLDYSQSFGGANNQQFKLDYFGTVRGRAGLAIDKFLPYITAGLAYGGATSSFSEAGGTFSEGKNHMGWTAGAGVEYAAADNITLKAEYLYTDLGTETYFQGRGTPRDANINFGMIRTGVNFKF